MNTHAMKTLAVCLFSSLAFACGATGGAPGGDPPDGGAIVDDAGDRGGDGGGHDDAGGDGGVDDGGGGGDDGGGGGTVTPVPLSACASTLTTYTTLPTGVSLPPAQTDPGPLMTRDARAFLFLESSALWTTSQAGSASTVARPAAIADGDYFGGFASVSGVSVITFQRGTTPYAVTYDGATFGDAHTIPCTAVGSGCVAHAAGDGHLWVRTGNVFYEQTGATFANRGGGPAGPLLWDVDAAGTVIVLGVGDSTQDERLSVWKLAAGAGGWTKVGALHGSDVAAVDPLIEGGFQLTGGVGIGPGTIAPDGSIHVFSDPRCIGTGQRNKTQVYARSRDGVTWSVEVLPAADELYAGNVSWKHAAFWASDYDNVRYVTMTSTEPSYDGFSYSYPDRRYDVVGRCLDANGDATFGSLATTRHRGWTVRGYAAFSETGAVSLLTQDGLTQAE
jgi:hypothetical protein